jgi:hypothetical protein
MSKLAGDHVQVLVDGYELTGDMNNVAINDARDTYDVTAFSDAVHSFIVGKRNVSVNHSGYMNATAAQSHPVLKGIGVQGMVSLMLGQNAAPAIGDPMYSLSVLQADYKTNPQVGNFIPFSANFSNQGTQGGWGVALTDGIASFTNTSNGAAVDNSAASSNGGAAYLHVLQAAASDTYSIVVQEDDNSGFSSPTTIATFTLDASALGSERIAISGSIERYTRWLATRTGAAGDTVQIAVNLVRF